MPRWILAALGGAVVLFLWSFVSHMVIKIEESALRGLPNDAAITALLREHVKEGGAYFYPNEPDMEKSMALMATSPSGLVTYIPPGEFNFGATLGRQFGMYLVCSLIAAWLFQKALPGLNGLGDKLLFAALPGLFAIVLVTGGYANWYGMPWGLVTAGLVDQGVAWTLTGLLFAKVITRTGRPAPMATHATSSR
jgi:hypothetical protein